ncbi:right-handed parallel beta-helix repeat-containing protein [Gleimia hominis]|uniref:Right-handed parallel beta-helix repeat-containing protein n=1 Tax=Gleimia hominis TaxID=595468 RepID=A0ABU3I8F5_9ACTO|nr:right-handed parallel beta-helix repeat-containing protein [Gleimia hominis]MDT3766658.1 right-handed parallel beta-helix repeat-containing protein [Gleimia hominis]
MSFKALNTARSLVGAVTAAVLCVLLAVIAPAAYADELVQTVSVADFGAKADSKQDAAEPVKAAIAKAKTMAEKGVSVRIVFPAGRYDIYPDKAPQRTLYVSNTVGADASYKEKRIGMLLEDTKNITVDGQGSEIIFHGKMTTFAAINSENVSFKNFQVDFEVPSAIDLTVEAVDPDAGIATVYVPEEYKYRVKGSDVEWFSDKSPYTHEAYWTERNALPYVQRYDTKSGLTVRGDVWNNPIFKHVAGVKDLGNNRLEFSYTQMESELKNARGISYQMRQTVRDHPGVFLWKDKNVRLDTIDFRFLHGFGVVGQSTDTVQMNNLHFGVGVGTGRSTAGYADFIQMSGCKGAVEVTNSTFSNPHDDPINIHGTFQQVVERISDRKVRVRYMHNETAGFPSFFVGDQVEFMTQGNMIPVRDSVRTVVAVDGPDGQGGNLGQGSGSLTDTILTFDKPIPQEIAVNEHVVENITYTPNVTIKNNVFKETPTRGILVTTRGKVLIEDNLFDGMGMAGIYISNDAQGWYESGPTRDVTIRANTFQRSGAQAILVEPTNPTVSSEDTVHKNMAIEDNTFYVSDQRVLDAKSVSNLRFVSNRVYRQTVSDGVQIDGGQAVEVPVGGAYHIKARPVFKPVNEQKLFAFNGSKQVVLANNTYDVGLNPQAELENMDAGELDNSGDGTAPQDGGIAVEDASGAENAAAQDAGAVENTAAEDTSGAENAAAQDRVAGESGKVFFVSADPAVATVDSAGVVTGMSVGQTTVQTYVLAGERRLPGPVVAVSVKPADVETAPGSEEGGSEEGEAGQGGAGQGGTDQGEDGQGEAGQGVAGQETDSLRDHPSSVATLSKAVFSGLSRDWKFTAGQLHYFAADRAKTILGQLTATDADAEVTATFNGQPVEPTEFAGTLLRGRNVLEVTVRAADGITSNTYRFVIDRISSNDPGTTEPSDPGTVEPAPEITDPTTPAQQPAAGKQNQSAVPGKKPAVKKVRKLVRTGAPVLGLAAAAVCAGLGGVLLLRRRK